MARDAVNPSDVDVREGHDAFVDKWRARWPEWRIAEAFVPAAQRARALAWAALRQELTDAAWAHRETRPGDAKLAWWAEELHGWTRGARRHPLGAVLQKIDAPWATLAAALPTLPATRERPRDRDEAWQTLRACADAVSAIDAALFGRSPSLPDAVIAQLLATRALHDPHAAIPLAEQARAGQGDARAGWNATVLAHWPAHAGGSAARSIELRLSRTRLARGDMARPLGALATLSAAWRAARSDAS